jgi:hypothetical protein
LAVFASCITRNAGAAKAKLIAEMIPRAATMSCACEVLVVGVADIAG